MNIMHVKDLASSFPFPFLFKKRLRMLMIRLRNRVAGSRETSLGKCNPPGIAYFPPLTRERVWTGAVTKPGIINLDKNEQQRVSLKLGKY